MEEEYLVEGLQLLTRYLFGLEEDAPVEQAQMDAVKGTLEKLPAADREIITKRYGIGWDRCQTLAELAGAFGTDREAIRLQEAKALRQMKQLLK